MQLKWKTFDINGNINNAGSTSNTAYTWTTYHLKSHIM